MNGRTFVLRNSQEKPENCFESFEEISAQVKGDYLWTDPLPEYPEVGLAEDDSRRVRCADIETEHLIDLFAFLGFAILHH